MDKTVKAETNGLAVASLIFGILSILSFWTVVLPIPQACLAFAFSLLSRGNKKKCTMAVIGTVLGIIGVILSVVFISVMIEWLYNMLMNSEFGRYLMMLLENLSVNGGGIR